MVSLQSPSWEKIVITPSQAKIGIGYFYVRKNNIMNISGLSQLSSLRAVLSDIQNIIIEFKEI